MEKGKRLAKRWFIDAMGGMAIGLMASLVVGVYFSQLSGIKGLGFLAPLAAMAAAASPVIGGAVGVAIAYTLKHKPLIIFSSAITGAVGYVAGGPMGAFVAGLVGAEVGSLVVGRTKLDIVLTPFVVIAAGGLVGQYVGPGIGWLMTRLGELIMTATELQPFFMGIVLSGVFGLAITSPISSAALAISLGLSGLAAGAATVGCCTHMIGYAVIGYRDNGLDGLFAHGIGTSKLQLPNVLKKPMVVLPPLITSLIMGPIATVGFQMLNNKMGAGMGGSGFVGQINTYISMAGTASPAIIVLKIVLVQYVLPAAICYLVYTFMRKKGWIADGDMKIHAIE